MKAAEEGVIYRWYVGYNSEDNERTTRMMTIVNYHEIDEVIDSDINLRAVL